MPSLKPSFSFSRSDTVFTIGSCFARNVERAIGKLGCRVPMLGFKTRQEEWESRPASMLNKFTPPNFKESMEWTAKVFDSDGIVRAEDCVDYALDLGDGTFIDPDLGSKVPVSFERFVERRQEIYDVFCSAFHAEVPGTASPDARSAATAAIAEMSRTANEFARDGGKDLLAAGAPARRERG